MANCKHFGICGLEAIDPEGLCILHSKGPKKSKETFQKALKDRLEAKNYNFGHFYFPEETSNFSGKTLKWADFSWATFEKEVDFRVATFEKRATFLEVNFQGKAFFNGATFQEEVSFEVATFEGEASFGSATFKDKAIFRDVIFKEKADFFSATFENEADFTRGTFEGDVFFIGWDEHRLFSDKFPSYFSSVRFVQHELVRFERVNLSRVSFIQTDLRKVQFVNVQWHRTAGRDSLFAERKVVEKWKKEKKRKEETKEEMQLVEDLYRQLKQNFEENRNWETAGDFHYGEMEMKRKRRSFLRDPFLWLYWFLSGYSERVWRALGCLVFFWVGFGLFYWLSGMDTSGFHSSMPPTSQSRIFSSFLYSLKVITFQGPYLVLLNPLGLWIQTIESIFGAIQIALLVLALRQRLRR